MQRERNSPAGQFPLTCSHSSDPAQSCSVGWCRGSNSTLGILGLGEWNITSPWSLLPSCPAGWGWFPPGVQRALRHEGPPVQLFKPKSLAHPEQEQHAQIPPGWPPASPPSIPLALGALSMSTHSRSAAGAILQPNPNKRHQLLVQKSWTGAFLDDPK